MAVSIELSKKLDKEYESKTLAEILNAPPSALAGLTENTPNSSPAGHQDRPRPRQ